MIPWYTGWVFKMTMTEFYKYKIEKKNIIIKKIVI